MHLMCSMLIIINNKLKKKSSITIITSTKVRSCLNGGITICTIKDYLGKEPSFSTYIFLHKQRDSWITQFLFLRLILKSQRTQYHL